MKFALIATIVSVILTSNADGIRYTYQDTPPPNKTAKFEVEGEVDFFGVKVSPDLHINKMGKTIFFKEKNPERLVLFIILPEVTVGEFIKLYEGKCEPAYLSPMGSTGTLCFLEVKKDVDIDKLIEEWEKTKMFKSLQKNSKTK